MSRTLNLEGSPSSFHGWRRAVRNGGGWINRLASVFLWLGLVAECTKTCVGAGEPVLAPGFGLETLHVARVGEGSWICLAEDGLGRLLVAPQEEEFPLLRVELSAGGGVRSVTDLALPVRAVMGMAADGRTLYLNGRGPGGRGLYRWRDLDEDDRYDTGELDRLLRFEGDGEHGPHGVVLGRDGFLYVAQGNHTELPGRLAAGSPFRGPWQEGVLPGMDDPTGHAVGIRAPGGHVLRVRPVPGAEPELYLGGLRNAYDLAIDGEGELFLFDSDMEYDWGTPWYRPCRIVHGVPGGEYGWRAGSGKWPAGYPDSLPAVVDVGLGSPTGVLWGGGVGWPARFERALLVEDWAYGRLMAIHLRPEGSTYVGQIETLITGRPLNLTDLARGRDGEIYLITGGRGTRSTLYRLTHFREERDTVVRTADPREPAASALRRLRRDLERAGPGSGGLGLEELWTHLGSDDRWIRYAARTALERWGVSEWRDRALIEGKRAPSAWIALARRGATADREAILERLVQLKVSELGPDARWEAMRALQVVTVGEGSGGRVRLHPAIDAWLGAGSMERGLEAEVARVAAAVDHPRAFRWVLDRFEAAGDVAERMHYAECVSWLSRGWDTGGRRTLEAWVRDPRAAFPAALGGWFAELGLSPRLGVSFEGYFGKIADRLQERHGVLTTERWRGVGRGRTDLAGSAASVGMRPVVRAWAMSDFVGDAAVEGGDRDRGREVWQAVQCGACHRMGEAGGSSGPDLTTVSLRLTRRDVLSAILDPSAVVSELYRVTEFELEDGTRLSGRILAEEDGIVRLAIDPVGGGEKEVKAGSVRGRRVSQISWMPAGLVNVLTRTEILDLLAFIESGGRG